VTAADVMATIWAMRGLVQATTDFPPDAWHRYLAIHLAGLQVSVSVDGTTRGG
jgi:hypothetical protein